MSQASKRRSEPNDGPVRVLGRGLGAQRGVRLTLRALREGAGKTQIDVRDSSRIDQGDISRLEARETFDDYQVSTLQRYLSALGGELELVAVFGDRKIIVTGAYPTRLADSPEDAPSPKRGRRAMRRSYDFSGGVRGKYVSRFSEGTNVVVLAPDVAASFKTSKAVNDALRSFKRRSTHKGRPPK
jgi:hypothetical protein